MAFRDGKSSCLLCDDGSGTTPAPTPDFVSWDADCLSSDEVGHFIYVTGVPIGGFRQVAKCEPTDSAKMPSPGIIISKSNATRCVVQVLGELATTGLSPGVDNRYWIGADSKLANAPPATPASGTIVVQVAGVALEGSILMLRPDLNPVKLRG